MTTILVVDDDADVRDALAEALEANNYQVTVARHGAQALEMLCRLPAPHLIVLDLMMPVVDGYEFMERKQADPALAPIPVLVITAGRHEHQKPIGAAEMLYKPFQFDRFLNLIRKHCA